LSGKGNEWKPLPATPATTQGLPPHIAVHVIDTYTMSKQSRGVHGGTLRANTQGLVPDIALHVIDTHFEATFLDLIGILMN
jgi:hypothetical protein